MADSTPGRISQRSAVRGDECVTNGSLMGDPTRRRRVRNVVPKVVFFGTASFAFVEERQGDGGASGERCDFILSQFGNYLVLDSL
jgi:hypothetical protein